MVYKPSEDTFFFLDFLDNLELKEKKFLDMGTGNGELALKAAENGANVVAADRDPEAVQFTRDRFEDRQDLSAEIIHSDLFENIQTRFDMIVFNAPYVPSAEKEYVDLDGGSTGDKTALRFLDEASDYLNEGGRAFVMTSSLGGSEVSDLQNVEPAATKSLWFEELTIWRYCPSF